MENPVLLAEVLSDSTAAYDSAKFHYDSELPSLRKYIMVEHDTFKVETRYRSAPNENWVMDWFEGEDAEIILRSVNLIILMAEPYRGTEEL